jgi:hypothetical protein
MLDTISSSAKPNLKLFKRGTLVKGQPAQMECVEINGQTFSVSGGALNVVRVAEEWYEDLADPERVIEALRRDPSIKPDIFTFWQRLPDIEPRYKYHKEWESLATLPVQSYDDWFNTKIASRVRSLIRKSKKEGLEVREVPYDDEFVRGMTEIFNEAPVRQGRKFWHYGKDFKTIKEQFSRFIFREDMIGAYFEGELIGFIMLGNAGRFAITEQIISKMKHRDKATNNVLIAKAVEVCARRQLPHLVYLYWTNDSLAEFKRRCGFEETKVPRYFVPLTQKGKMALKLGLHHGLKAVLPEPIKSRLKRVRKFWNEFRTETAA